MVAARCPWGRGCSLPFAYSHRCEYFMPLNIPMLVHIVQHFETARENEVLCTA